MSYFTKDFIDFFTELASNNKKEWFDANKARFKESVQQPFEEFIGEMILRIGEDDPSVKITPKEAVIRIYRDVRFSKDKSPYKKHMSAIISPGGKKDKSTPGTYLQLDAEFVRYYGGAHYLEKETLQNVRTEISKNLSGFSKLITDSNFKEKFGGIHGEQHKRIPPEFQDAAEKQPLIANKQFYYFAKLPSKQILDPKLADTLMEYYFAAKPLNLFFKKAMAR